MTTSAITYDQPNLARSYRRRDVMNREVVYPVIVQWDDSEANALRRRRGQAIPLTAVLCSSVDYLDGPSGIAAASMDLLQYFNNGGPLDRD